MHKKITICTCCSRYFIDKEKTALLAAETRSQGWEVSLVADLCEMVQQKDKSLGEVAEGTVAACHPRAVKSLLASCGEKAERLLNNRTDSLEEQLKAIGLEQNIQKTVEVEAYKQDYLQQMEDMPRKLGEDAWFPTLDKDICGECGKCLDFCPFGVYEMVEDRIRVAHPANCKNNCPACARTCPACAVIFPKYDRSPINGGEEKQEEAIQLNTRTLYAQAFKERLEHRRAVSLSFVKPENKK